MSRSIVPPGKAGLILIFALATPVVLATCRPLTRRIGEEMKKIGEKLQEFADEGTDKPDAAPNADMKADRQTAAAASPTGKAEVEANAAAQTKGSPKTEKPPARAKRTAEVKTKPDQPVNPKRTGVTPAKAKAKPKAKKTPGV